MLDHGEKVGSGSGMVIDVAVDPVNGTTLTAPRRLDAQKLAAISTASSNEWATGAPVTSRWER